MIRRIEFEEKVEAGGGKFKMIADTPRDLLNMLWDLRNSTDAAIERVTIEMQAASPPQDERDA